MKKKMLKGLPYLPEQDEILKNERIECNFKWNYWLRSFNSLI